MSLRRARIEQYSATFNPWARKESAYAFTTSGWRVVSFTLATPVDVGQIQNPSWCLVVRQPQVMPADFAALAHCSVSKFNGLNTPGGSFGSPHSRSWKVARLK